MNTKLELASYFRADACKDFSNNQNNNKEIYNCKSIDPQKICNSEFKSFFCNKRNKLTYKFGEQIDSRDASYLFELLKNTDRKAFSGLFSVSLFTHFATFGFNLTTFSLSVKKRGQFSHCAFDNPFRCYEPTACELILNYDPSNASLFSLSGELITKDDISNAMSLLNSGTLFKPSLLQEMDDMGFDLSTFELSLSKILTD